MINDDKALEVARRVKEKLDFWLDMEKQNCLYNWGGNEVVWLLEYLWNGGRFNNIEKNDWIIALSKERDEAIEKLKVIKDKVIEISNESPENKWDEWTTGRTQAAEEILRVVTKLGITSDIDKNPNKEV